MQAHLQHASAAGRVFKSGRPSTNGRAYRAVQVRATVGAHCDASPSIKYRLAACLAAGALTLAGASTAAEKVGEFPASGIVFKDSVQTLAIDDPEVQGVTIYISDFERNLADKISKFGEEPSSASVTCATTGPIVIKNPKKIRGMGGEDVFSEKKGLGFLKNKTLHVRRIFDEGHKSLLYVAYSTRLMQDSKGESPGRYKTSICALPISSTVTAVEKTDTNADSGLFAPAKSDST